ncbi:GNAT family N-acetyltransferase [Deinococcus sp. MIMF12]|uniref:GNAT family N-acetyltransferase n=1 Tax=Deinococcus rhizophilus TaxID=3049544 RepID=A0ABT7JEI6_9DEIO|nr:GNAT family N-acetyltransferase [Deinococcus rhizophilus]MDL2343470.1 GNAT family N-acetyltransferase [Deinococcus rhizophilus]
MRLPAGYALRPATPADAPAVARQRAQMFVDMGTLTPEAAAPEVPLWTDWLRGALASGEYVGLLAEWEGTVVGGAGLMFFPRIPTLKDPATRKAHVLNVSVDPAHRRRGLAGALMGAALEEVRARGLRQVTLNAAPLGRPIYERLGFVESTHPELRLTLEPPA